MEPIQQPNDPIQPGTVPGKFSFKIPVSIAFAIGILLFFLPFAEIKCGSTKIASNTGFGMAAGKKWNTPSSTGNRSDTDKNKDEGSSSDWGQENKKGPNIYAIAALGLGVLGLLLSFSKARSAATAAMVTGILSAITLTGLMFDLKKMVKGEPAGTGSKQEGNDLFGLEKLNDMKMTVDFTPWFYIAIFAFLAAAFFSYRQVTTRPANQINPV